MLVFGASFYFKLQENSMQREFSHASQLRAIQTGQRIFTLPELDCSFAGVQRENCVDLLKVNEFSRLLSTDEAAQITYFDTFQYSTVTVHEAYPANESWTLYQKHRASSFTSIQIPVLLYDALSRHNRFGYIEVKVYE